MIAFIIIILFVIATPVSATDYTLHPGDSIQEAINSSDTGDTIILNPGTYYEQDIFVGKDITVKANRYAGGNPENTIIDAKNSGRIFIIHDSHSLTIDKLSLHNGQSDGDGGAIYSRQGNITVISSTFFNCSATQEGGAIFLYSGILSINSTTFDRCSATKFGGAIYLKQGILTINSSAFTNCMAGDSGSAIQSSYGRVIVTSTTFADCMAVDGGGAILVAGRDGAAGTISDSTFTNCTARYGGAIHTLYRTLTIDNSTFSNCRAMKGSGGAIISEQGTLIVDRSGFFNCSSQQRGGAIDLNYHNAANVSSSTFVRCSAKYGGAIGSGAGTATIRSSRFSGNSACQGGAIYTTNSNVVVNSSVFSRCVAPQGEVIYSRGGSTVTVDKESAINNDLAGIPGSTINVINNTSGINLSGLAGESVVNKSLDTGARLLISSSSLVEDTFPVLQCMDFDSVVISREDDNATMKIIPLRNTPDANSTAISAGGAIYSDGGTVNIPLSVIISTTTVNDRIFNVTVGQPVTTAPETPLTGSPRIAGDSKPSADTVKTQKSDAPGTGGILVFIIIGAILFMRQRKD